MTSAPLRRQRRLRAALVLGLLALPACGHGHHHGYVVLRGTLEVFNHASSRASVEGIEAQAVGSRVGDFRSVRATPGTGVFFDLAVAHYDVSVFWDAGERDTFFDVPVRQAATTTLDVRF